MQFKIPQDIEQEDKLFLFISLRQLFVLLGGGGVAYVIYVGSVGRFSPSIYMIPVVIILILTVLLAFFRMENITFIRLILLILEQMINPQTRIWQHYNQPLLNLNRLEALADMAKNSPKEDNYEKNSDDRSLARISSIADIVDTSNLDIGEENNENPKQPTQKHTQ